MDNDQEMVTIPLATYKELCKESVFLTALELMGVDKWEGYNQVKESLNVLESEITNPQFLKAMENMPVEMNVDDLVNDICEGYYDED